MNNVSADTVLNIFQSFIEMSLKGCNIVFVQSLPPDQDMMHMCSVLDVFADTCCGYGLHSSASNELLNGLVGGSLYGKIFV